MYVHNRFIHMLFSIILWGKVELALCCKFACIVMYIFINTVSFIQLLTWPTFRILVGCSCPRSSLHIEHIYEYIDIFIGLCILLFDWFRGIEKFRRLVFVLSLANVKTGVSICSASYLFFSCGFNANASDVGSFKVWPFDSSFESSLMQLLPQLRTSPTIDSVARCC